MKKTYINPKLNIVRLEVRQILVVSDPKVGNEYNGEQSLSRQFDYDEDYEDEEEY